MQQNDFIVVVTKKAILKKKLQLHAEVTLASRNFKYFTVA